MSPQQRDILRRTLDWLRQGHPHGLPASDYAAVLGVLRRRLTDEEIELLAEDLAADDEAVSADDIRQLIRDTHLQEPRKKDVNRVTEALAEEGVDVVAPSTGE